MPSAINPDGHRLDILLRCPVAIEARVPLEVPQNPRLGNRVRSTDTVTNTFDILPFLKEGDSYRSG